MWPPHTNSRVPERERRLRVWLAASMIAMVDDPPGDVDGAGKFGRDAVQDGARRPRDRYAGPCRDGRRQPRRSVPARKGETLHQRTVIAIREALEIAGLEFIDENGGGPGVRLRRR